MALQGNFATAIREFVTDLVTADKVNINEAIFQSTFAISDLTKFHTLVTGVRDGSLVPIVLAGNDYGSMPAGNEKSCTLNSCSTDESYSNVRWSLGEYNCRVELCLRTLDEDFLIFWNMYRQRLEDPLQEPDAQAYLSFLTEQSERRIKGTQWRISYLGDKNSNNNLINNNDGFFVQADAGDGVKININDETPTGEEIYNALMQGYDQTTGQLWRAETDLVWKMTWVMADKIVQWLNSLDNVSQYNCDCINPDKLVTSNRFFVEGLRIAGVPVEVHREIDGSMNALAMDNKFQAILARKSNLLIGTNTTDKMEDFDIFFDKKDKKIYIDTMVYLGASIPLQEEYVYISNEVGS